MAEIDPFYLFRATLFVALTCFTIITFAETVVAVTRILSGDEPHRRVLRSYLAYQILSIRLAPLRGELAGIALGCAALMLLWILHRLL